MDTENRRSFVKKSLATSMTFTFSGLIRAHGDEGGDTTYATTSNPEETTFATTDSGGITTYNPDETTVAEETTTWNPEDTTIVSTPTSTIESTCNYAGVFGAPSGYNESPIVQGGSSGFVSAKAQIESIPFSGVGESVTVKIRTEIWETEDYSTTVKNSAWFSITGWIDENGCFQSSSSDRANCIRGAVLRTTAWFALITVKSITSTPSVITANVEFTLEYGSNPSPLATIPLELSVEAF